MYCTEIVRHASNDTLWSPSPLPEIKSRVPTVALMGESIIACTGVYLQTIAAGCVQYQSPCRRAWEPGSASRTGWGVREESRVPRQLSIHHLSSPIARWIASGLGGGRCWDWLFDDVGGWSCGSGRARSERYRAHFFVPEGGDFWSLASVGEYVLLELGDRRRAYRWGWRGFCVL